MCFDITDSIKEELEATYPGIVSCADILVLAAREEKDWISNETLKGFDITDSIKEELEATYPGIVSCADILVLAAREEKDWISNETLKGFDITDSIKEELEATYPGIVSCADILVLAAREGAVRVKDLKGLCTEETDGKKNIRIHSEKDWISNETLKGFDITDSIKEELEATYPGIVSCADILVLAAREGAVRVKVSLYVFIGAQDLKGLCTEETDGKKNIRIHSEKDWISNETLKGFDITDSIKEELEATYPGIVSCADILVLAAREGAVRVKVSLYVFIGAQDLKGLCTEETDGKKNIRIHSEKDWISNETLKGFDITDSIKEELEATYPGIVSCADILVLAAREEKDWISNETLKGFDITDSIKEELEATYPGIVSCADILVLAAREGAVRVKVSLYVFIGAQDLKGLCTEETDGKKNIRIHSEKDWISNETLKGFDITDSIKEELEATYPGIVSCADILVLAAREGAVRVKSLSLCVHWGPGFERVVHGRD
ncbi:hypothetical protein AAG906_015999 [Vitis piasezkii]